MVNIQYIIMKFDNLPDDIIKLIFYYRKELTTYKKTTTYIQSHWIGYRNRALLGRFRMLKYLKEFREFNPSIKQFLLR
jgi:hypothetical protein